MKKTKTMMALSLVLLVLISILSGCGGGKEPVSEESAQQDSSAAAETQSSDSTTPAGSAEELIVIPPPPAGWTKVDDSAVEAMYGIDTATFIVKLESFSGTTLEDITQEDRDALKTAFDAAQFTEPENMKVGGKDAVKFTFLDGEGPTSMRCETIIVLSGELSYVITCADLDSSFDSRGFDDLINAITF